MAVWRSSSAVVPNRISDGRALPKIDVLIRGMKFATYDESGAFLGDAFTNNPAWVTLDLLGGVDGRR